MLYVECLVNKVAFFIFFPVCRHYVIRTIAPVCNLALAISLPGNQRGEECEVTSLSIPTSCATCHVLVSCQPTELCINELFDPVYNSGGWVGLIRPWEDVTRANAAYVLGLNYWAIQPAKCFFICNSDKCFWTKTILLVTLATCFKRSW